MTVRFKEQYSESNPRISYELASEEKIWSIVKGMDEICYQTKLFGCVPVRWVEITEDPKDVAAVDIYIELSNTE